MRSVLFSAQRRWWVVKQVLWGSLLVAGLSSTSMSVRAAEDDSARNGIAVIYPDIGEPYSSVFATIIDGIEDRARSKVPSFAIARSNAAGLPDQLRARHVRAVIALGRSGLQVASSLDQQINVVAGGVLSVPAAEADGMFVQSLAPDPALLFGQLKSLATGVRRVWVVYDPKQNEWLIKLARDAARLHGLELQAIPADDLKSAVKRYQELFASLNAKRDALWLPQDTTTVDDAVVVPLVLKASWDQNLIVFSSNVAHVRRGVLFSLYPDNAEMGRHLAATALASLQPGGAPPHGLQALRQVLTAVNTRTAEHLGVDLRTSQQRIQLVLPEQ